MRHSTKDNYLYLTTTPVPRLIVSLAVPTIISMLVTSFYNMADTYFVGKINTQSTAAVGIVFSVMSIIQAVGFFFGSFVVSSGIFSCPRRSLISSGFSPMLISREACECLRA